GHRPRPCRVVRVGNQLGAEIGLDVALRSAGAQVTDLPLGDYILQMAGEEAAHPLFPAIHVRKEAVAALFRERLDLPETLDPQVMTSMARYHQRRAVLQADLAISEAALAVAEPGALALATVDGSERLAVSLAPTHVVLMGIADVVANLDELFLLMRAKALNGLGRPAMPSLTLLLGPAGPDEHQGPRQLHLVIVDNGRSELLRRGLGDALACIRCGACANLCPVYGEVGGGIYGSAPAGPIGAVVIPLRPARPGPAQAAERRPLPARPSAVASPASELPWASTLCAACTQACPVGIDIHGLLVRLRSESPPAVSRSSAQRMARAWAWAALSPERYRWLARALAGAGRGLSVEVLRSVAPPLHPWARIHRWPPPAARSFRERWERRRRAQAARPADHDRVSSRLAAAPVVQPDASAHVAPAPPPPGDLLAALTAAFLRWHVTWEVAESVVAARLALVAQLQAAGEPQVLSWADDALPVPGLVAALATVGLQVLVPDRRPGYNNLPKDADRTPLGLTGVDAALADSGALLMLSGPGRPALAAQLPRRHIALLPASRIYPSTDAWLRALSAGDAVSTRRCISLVAGPSQSLDIELERAVGLHGPRSLHVVVIQGA
ncbi:MAG: LUD domain-containing protein, partial [Caldilineales bacterium]|nr:LUD domain-containing protein [Caldilineales bacterium]